MLVSSLTDNGSPGLVVLSLYFTGHRHHPVSVPVTTMGSYLNLDVQDWAR